MDKQVRKAVKCYLMKDDKVVVTKYKSGNRKEGYYDIPGGKMEEGESPKQTAIREMKEETGMSVKNIRHKGNMIVEYPDRKFIFDVFVANEYEGEPQEFEENIAEWIEMKELLQKEKVLSNIMILDRFFRKGLLDEDYKFSMCIAVNDKEEILGVDYRLSEIW